MSYMQHAKELYNMIYSGKLLDAFDKYYHKDVVMQEATGDVREGKSTCRAYPHFRTLYSFLNKTYF